jgi:hypothetical protein
MDDKIVEYIRKAIYFLDKISYIPALSISILFFIFFLEIFVNPFDWISLCSIYLLGSFIGFLIFTYDRNHISHKIENEEFDQIVLDALCWGILGTIFHGIGIFILIKGLLVLIYIVDENFLSDKHKKKETRLEIGLKLYSSLNSLSRLAGLVIILLVFYRLGISILLNVFDQIYLGNFQALFQPFIICFVISVIVLLFDHDNEQFAIHNMNINPDIGSKDLIKGILGCCFYASGIFILFRGIIGISFQEERKNKSQIRSEKKIESFVIYSNPIR